MKPGKSLKFLFDGKDEREITINNLVVAGWTGRNVEAMEAHILELEELAASSEELASNIIDGVTKFRLEGCEGLPITS